MKAAYKEPRCLNQRGSFSYRLLPKIPYNFQQHRR